MDASPDYLVYLTAYVSCMQRDLSLMRHPPGPL